MSQQPTNFDLEKAPNHPPKHWNTRGNQQTRSQTHRHPWTSTGQTFKRLKCIIYIFAVGPENTKYPRMGLRMCLRV